MLRRDMHSFGTSARWEPTASTAVPSGFPRRFPGGVLRRDGRRRIADGSTDAGAGLRSTTRCRQSKSGGQHGGDNLHRMNPPARFAYFHRLPPSCGCLPHLANLIAIRMLTPAMHPSSSFPAIRTNSRMRFRNRLSRKCGCARPGTPSSVSARASSHACRSSQHPQRGLIQTDPPLWVGSYYRRSLLRARDGRRNDSPQPTSPLFQ